MAPFNFCIHGHFYQPPREDPITGEVPLEPGAAPYRNWNERIFDHCYRPNVELGNFEKISFNTGPTLMSWMDSYSPETVGRMIAQDRANFERYGVGNTMAQAYNHTILPLSQRHDKETQVRWGKGEFQHRYGHKPNGMWLPETAVDMETLQVLAENEIEFTILAPWQADTPDIDVTQPYHVRLKDGKAITVFFYHQELSMQVSFNPGATVNADDFISQTLMSRFRPIRRKTDKDQLLLIASDGELYGHHQPFRDKFLAYLLGGAMKNSPIQVTYPALWLKTHPPEAEMNIREFTSWSCHHGVKRWSSECACTPHPEWKAPLRRAFDQIAVAIDSQYLDVLSQYTPDPWELRHNYYRVLTGEEDAAAYIQRLLGGSLPVEDVERIRLLLQAQYERQRMFTSCGWFFDDLDRIEPRNNVSYAAQAVWLTFQATGLDLTSQALSWLLPVKSWRSGLRADLIFDHHMVRARKNQKAVKAPIHYKI
jgi:hypothetical protein